jgi:hypothetical protein
LVAIRLISADQAVGAGGNIQIDGGLHQISGDARRHE